MIGLILRSVGKISGQNDEIKWIRNVSRTNLFLHFVQHNDALFFPCSLIVKWFQNTESVRFSKCTINLNHMRSLMSAFLLNRD